MRVLGSHYLDLCLNQGMAIFGNGPLAGSAKTGRGHAMGRSSNREKRVAFYGRLQGLIEKMGLKRPGHAG